MGSALAYLKKANLKPLGMVDLKKAKWAISSEIEFRKSRKELVKQQKQKGKKYESK
jgi:hypothetical protein